jgi:hypothetical protein
MKTTIKCTGILIFGLGLFAAGCAKKKPATLVSIKNADVAAQIGSFVAEKKAEAEAAPNGSAPEFKAFFSAAEKGDWPAVSNAMADFRKHAPQYEHSGKTDPRLHGPAWQAVIEIWGTFDAFGEGDEKYSTLYANDIIDSIPSGSIYFGGTDPGRFLITGMEKSQVNGDPFFLLTQNALADSTYLDYLRGIYGNSIYIPTSDDQEKCFADYTADASRRADSDQLKSGEHVHKDSNGRVQISGQTAVMEINALLAKLIFDQNSNREFYIEESFPLDWMYPYLEPHGLIFKLNRQPLPELTDEIVQRDHDFWTQTITPMIGDWLNDDTSVQQIAEFAKKVFQQHDFTGFTGDPQFVQNDYSCKMFSKERASIADLYAWRMNEATDPAEKERMARAADFAYRQALALCPSNAQVASDFAKFLRGENREADAVLAGGMARY